VISKPMLPQKSTRTRRMIDLQVVLLRDFTRRRCAVSAERSTDAQCRVAPVGVMPRSVTSRALSWTITDAEPTMPRACVAAQWTAARQPRVRPSLPASSYRYNATPKRSDRISAATDFLSTTYGRMSVLPCFIGFPNQFFDDSWVVGSWRATMAEWEDELERWLKSFLDRLGHKTRQRMCPLYVAGIPDSPRYPRREPGKRPWPNPTRWG